jgi:hypothetical protein
MSQHGSGERQRRGIGLQCPLDVPLRVELAYPATDGLRVLGMPADTGIKVGGDAPVVVRACVERDPLRRSGDHRPSPS